MIRAVASRLLCVLIGHVYPLYKTFKACHVREGQQAIDGAKLVEIRRVLAFWAVHGAFTFAEFFVDFFVWWIPLYFEAKVLFLLWLVQGNFNGANFVFDNLISEVLNHHEADIDASLEKSKDAMKRSGGQAVAYMLNGAANLLALAMQKSQAMVLEGISAGNSAGNVGGQGHNNMSRRFEEVHDDDSVKKSA